MRPCCEQKVLASLLRTQGADRGTGLQAQEPPAMLRSPLLPPACLLPWQGGSR